MSVREGVLGSITTSESPGMDGGNPSYEVEGPWSMAHGTMGWVHGKEGSHQGGAYSNRAREDTWGAT